MSEQVVDVEEALERVQDDRELLIELFDIFQEDYAKKRKEIDDVLSKGDFDQLKNIAHSIKGASSNISAKNIYVSLLELESIAADGEVERINELMKLIDVKHDELSARIIKLKQELK